MKLNMAVDMHHLARIEGHGDIRVRVENGIVTKARWDVVETPRYFEVMLKGKHYTSVAVLTARICGICSIAHCLASLRATEDAFGIVIPETAAKLRLLAKHGETLQSHVLHLLFLAIPDFLNVPSVLPLVESDPDLVALALRLKGLANRLCDTVAGRTTHPVSLQVGGVTAMPDRQTLIALRDEIKRATGDLNRIAEVCRTLDMPAFERETEFVSLKGESSYPFLGGRLMSSDGVERSEQEYLAMTNEYVDEHNTSKLCKLSRDSLAVGALARFTNNHHLLHQSALDMAAQLGLSPGCHNPFMNNIAQLIECVHCAQDSIRLIDELVEAGDAETMAAVTPREGAGTAAVEAPRGILYHHYEYDADGRILRADCVIPTTQNNANIHHDMGAMVAELAAQGIGDKEMERLCAMLVRAYDPCLSCSVH